MYTVNNTNFFDFGVIVGDAQLEQSDNGGSSPIYLSTPIQFFGTTQDTLFVSQLCILSLKGIIDDDWCFIYTLMVMNNNAVTDLCSSDINVCKVIITGLLHSMVLVHR